MTATYNGIAERLQWPPRDVAPGGAPLPVPYLAEPPDVVPIDVGRQLFVDDFLIEHTNLRRVFHAAKVHDGAPVLSPETELERNRGHCPVAAPFNDGAWFDPADGKFKLFYHAGWFDGTALAISDDGLHWQRPELDAVPGTNAIVANPPGNRRDGALVWLDLEGSPEERYKMFIYWRWDAARPGAGSLYTSADGVRWRDQGRASACGDNTSFFYNPFRGKYVFSIRNSWDRRARSYYEHADFLQAARWEPGQPVRWARVDRLDRPDPFLGEAPQLYDVNAVAYESVLLGTFAVFHGPENSVAARLSRPKINDLQLAYSRDGFHWHRPSREPFIAASRRWGDWNYGYIHAAGGVCLVVGDELWFYFGAFSGQGSVLNPGETGGDFPQDNAMYAGGHTGLAVLRRDGFAGMAAGAEGGVLATRPVVFQGAHLFVNVAAEGGELRTEIVDDRGVPIDPFTRANCRPVRVDSTRAPVTWRGAENLAALRGRPVQFRFHLRQGELYSFWVSASPSGASGGYVAAGGPGFGGPADE